MTNNNKHADDSRRVPDSSLAIERAMRTAVREALIDHKRAGNTVVFCEGKEVRLVAAENIDIPDVPDAPAAQEG